MNDINDSTTYTFERLTENRLNDLAILYKAVYDHRPAGDYFEKKYSTAYTGFTYIGFIAYSHNLPVAYYGVMPCFMEYNNTIILAAQSGDTMTHPQHQKKGLFIRLAKHTFELCRSCGIQVVYGFPNQNSHRGLIKLGWLFTENLQRFHIPVKTFPVERLARKFSWTSRIYEKWVQRILSKYKLTEPGLSNTFTAEGFGGVYRNAEYLQYKQYNGSTVIQVGNAKAWIKIKNGLIIGDLHVQSDNFNKAMDAILYIAKKLGVSAVSFQTSPGTQLNALFAAKYKPVASFPTGFLIISNRIPVDQIKFTFADIDIF